MISTYLVPLEQVDQAREAHLRFLDGLAERVVSAGRQDPPVGGVVLLEAGSEAEAHEVMAGDPYVVQGLAEYLAVGWQPTRGVLAER
jgi:uncharacterized protein YciI